MNLRKLEISTSSSCDWVTGWKTAGSFLNFSEDKSSQAACSAIVTSVCISGKNGRGVKFHSQFHVMHRVRNDGALLTLLHTPSWHAHGQIYSYSGCRNSLQLWLLTRPPSAGSKFVAMRNTGAGWTPFSPFHIWLSAGDWLFWSSEMWGRQLSEFSWWVKACGLGLSVWTPLREVVLICLASRWGETAARIPRGGYAGVQVTSRR